MKVVYFVKSNNELDEVVSGVTDVSSWAGLVEMIADDSYVTDVRRMTVVDDISIEDAIKYISDNVESDWQELFGSRELGSYVKNDDWMSELDQLKAIDYNVKLVKVSYVYDDFCYNLGYIVVES